MNLGWLGVGMMGMGLWGYRRQIGWLILIVIAYTILSAILPYLLIGLGIVLLILIILIIKANRDQTKIMNADEIIASASSKSQSIATTIDKLHSQEMNNANIITLSHGITSGLASGSTKEQIAQEANIDPSDVTSLLRLEYYRKIIVGKKIPEQESKKSQSRIKLVGIITIILHALMASMIMVYLFNPPIKISVADDSIKRIPVHENHITSSTIVSTIDNPAFYDEWTIQKMIDTNGKEIQPTTAKGGWYYLSFKKDKQKIQGWVQGHYFKDPQESTSGSRIFSFFILTHIIGIVGIIMLMVNVKGKVPYILSLIGSLNLLMFICFLVLYMHMKRRDIEYNSLMMKLKPAPA
jgi:Na+-transporting methylmalonyl-CoA/oxaloacetate decarboxylase gamma subunit